MSRRSYLLVDDRASGGTLAEHDTEPCRHCGAHLLMRGPAYRRQGAFCTHCHGPVCDTPACATECVPFKRKLDEQLGRAALARALGLQER